MPDQHGDAASALAWQPAPGRHARMMPWPAVQQGIDAVAAQVRDAGIVPDAMIGIFQGGWMIAQGLADHFPGVPVLGVMASLSGGGRELYAELVSAGDGVLRPVVPAPGSIVLLVDEVVDSGRTARTFLALLRRDYQLRPLLACICADAGADPQPDFCADRMTELPLLVLPWRVQRDFGQAIACLLRACPLTTSQIDERLRDLGHDIPPDILEHRLGDLFVSGHVTRSADGRWASRR
jgi:hypoxanthine phosphoribosyltransferase